MISPCRPPDASIVRRRFSTRALPAPILFLLLIPVFAVTGCSSALTAPSRQGSSPHVQPQPGAPILVVVFDRSVPGFLAREQQVQQLDSLAKSAVEAGYVFELWTYDSAPARLFGPALLPGVDMLDRMETHDLAARAAPAPRRDAQPGKALSEALDSLSKSRATAARIVFLTDGFVADDLAPARTARMLADRPGVRVSVLGIDERYRRAWAQALSGALSGRLDLVDAKTATGLLKENRDE